MTRPDSRVHRLPAPGPVIRFCKLDAVRRAILAAGREPDSVPGIGGSSDLIPGKYEGGFKVWESTGDLVQWISENAADLKNKVILDLGCGAGLVGIACLLAGAARVTFHDFNQAVIEFFTKANVRLNILPVRRRLPSGKCTVFIRRLEPVPSDGKVRLDIFFRNDLPPKQLREHFVTYKEEPATRRSGAGGRQNPLFRSRGRDTLFRTIRRTGQRPAHTVRQTDSSPSAEGDPAAAIHVMHAASPFTRIKSPKSTRNQRRGSACFRAGDRHPVPSESVRSD